MGLRNKLESFCGKLRRRQTDAFSKDRKVPKRKTSKTITCYPFGKKQKRKGSDSKADSGRQNVTKNGTPKKRKRPDSNTDSDRQKVAKNGSPKKRKGSDSSADFYRQKVLKMTVPKVMNYPLSNGTETVKANEPESMSYLNFYQNKIGLPMGGDFIDKIHFSWRNDFEKLKSNCEYMKWLFPTLQTEAIVPQEIQKMNEDTIVRRRILKSYIMMLHFYGMRLVHSSSGEVRTGINWKERFDFLNRSPNHYPRIERMLKSLGQFKYDYLRKPFLKLLRHEIYVTRNLMNCEKAFQTIWFIT